MLLWDFVRGEAYQRRLDQTMALISLEGKRNYARKWGTGKMIARQKLIFCRKRSSGSLIPWQLTIWELYGIDRSERLERYWMSSSGKRRAFRESLKNAMVTFISEESPNYGQWWCSEIPTCTILYNFTMLPGHSNQLYSPFHCTCKYYIHVLIEV